MTYEPHTEHRWREWTRDSRLPLGYFDQRHPRHLGIAFFVVLIVALICVACTL